MFTAALVRIANTFKRPKCPLTEETNGYTKCGTSRGILFGRENEPSTNTCYNMNFENIMVRDRRQSSKTHITGLHL